MKILVTAGATWSKIDDVRILTNRFTGKTGLYLARELKKKGHIVNLVINPHCVGKVKGLKAVYYHYFEELKERLSKALKEPIVMRSRSTSITGASNGIVIYLKHCKRLAPSILAASYNS